MESVVNDVAFKRLERDMSQARHRVENPTSLEELNATLTLTQAELNKAMVKFNQTNPSDKKRMNPPRYVSWATICVRSAQKAIDERDMEILGNRKAYARYQWLMRNLDYVDSKIESNLSGQVE